MSYKQKVRDIIEQLFHSTGLRKEDFIGYKQRLESRPFFEDYVFPHKLNATELKIKSDIAKIISATPLIESANDITAFDLGKILTFHLIRVSMNYCSFFISEKIHPILALAVPKEVVKYEGPDTYEAQDASKPTKGKAPKSSNKRGLKQPRAQEAASIYDDEDDARASGKKQRLSTSSSSTIDNGATAKKSVPVKDEVKQKSATDSLLQTILPTNFHTVVRPFFDEFWRLEFDSTEVTWAFFAKITAVNCAEYKLSTFAQQSSSLAVIKVRL